MATVSYTTSWDTTCVRPASRVGAKAIRRDRSSRPGRTAAMLKAPAGIARSNSAPLPRPLPTSFSRRTGGHKRRRSWLAARTSSASSRRRLLAVMASSLVHCQGFSFTAQARCRASRFVRQTARGGDLGRGEARRSRSHGRRARRSGQDQRVWRSQGSCRWAIRAQAQCRRPRGRLAALFPSDPRSPHRSGSRRAVQAEVEGGDAQTRRVVRRADGPRVREPWRCACHCALQRWQQCGPHREERRYASLGGRPRRRWRSSGGAQERACREPLGSAGPKHRSKIRSAWGRHS